jgi:hypothetical protein
MMKTLLRLWREHRAWGRVRAYQQSRRLAEWNGVKPEPIRPRLFRAN